MAYIKGEDRNQVIMFPQCLDEYITVENPVRVIDAFVDGLGLEQLGFKRTASTAVGHPSYDPSDILKLYLYGYLNRIRSSRRLEHETIRNIEVIWLLKKLSPDFKTIADFRKDNKKPLKAVFRAFTKLCDDWDLFGKELVAIYGSKFSACNSKRNNYSVKKLERYINYIDEKIEHYLQILDDGDISESLDRKPAPSEVHDKIQALRARKGKYEEYIKGLKESNHNEISTTDPDARLMCNNNNNVDVSYNVQTTVDAKHKLIADFKVSQKPNDLGELDNMALRAKKLFGGKEFEALADKGYYKAEDLKKCVKNGITPYVTKQIYSNGAGDKDFYTDKFKYDRERKVYIWPGGKELFYHRDRKKEGKIIGYEYRNYAACKHCEYKMRCTKVIRVEFYADTLIKTSLIPLTYKQNLTWKNISYDK